MYPHYEDVPRATMPPSILVLADALAVEGVNASRKEVEQGDAFDWRCERQRVHQVHDLVISQHLSPEAALAGESSHPETPPHA